MHLYVFILVKSTLQHQQKNTDHMGKSLWSVLNRNRFTSPLRLNKTRYFIKYLSPLSFTILRR